MAEPPKPPTLADLAQPPGPVYLRKMNKKSDWGSEEAPPDQRVIDIIKLIFPRDDHPYSVYLVRSDEELHRVIIGMNGGRESPTSESYFLAIRLLELQAAGITANPTDGLTLCRYANSLHHDLIAEHDQIRALCLGLIADGRKAAAFSKGRTKRLLPPAEAIQCLALKGPNPCLGERCA